MRGDSKDKCRIYGKNGTQEAPPLEELKRGKREHKNG
jgi:hypothetical protein